MRIPERIDVLYAPVYKDARICGVDVISGRRAYGHRCGPWNLELQARGKMTQSLAGTGGNRHLVHRKGYLRISGYCQFVCGRRSKILYSDAHSRRATLLLVYYFADSDVSS